MPDFYERSQRPDHPFILDYARAFNFDDYFESPDDVRRAVSGYLGLCSFMDEQVGKVLAGARGAGLAQHARDLHE